MINEKQKEKISEILDKYSKTHNKINLSITQEETIFYGNLILCFQFSNTETNIRSSMVLMCGKRGGLKQLT